MMERGLSGRVAEPQVPAAATAAPLATPTSIDIASLVSSFSSEFAAKTEHPELVTTSSSQVFPSSSTPAPKSSVISVTRSHTTSISLSTESHATSINLSTESASSPIPTSVAVDPAATSSTGIDHRTLTIILSTILGCLGILFLVLAFNFIRRYRHRQPPFSRFSHRGASPIDDEEIATWRGNSQEMAKTPAMHVRNISSIVFEPSQKWVWEGSPSPSTSPTGAGAAVAYPAPVVARAPNARSGLTDDAVPGDAPFVKTAGRHSRRLSKVTSNSHIRSKSQRSSTSVHSVKEGRPSMSKDRNQWREPDAWAVKRDRSHSMGRPKKSLEGRTSMDDDVRPIGLAPRPQAPATISLSHLPGAAL